MGQIDSLIAANGVLGYPPEDADPKGRGADRSFHREYHEPDRRLFRKTGVVEDVGAKGRQTCGLSVAKVRQAEERLQGLQQRVMVVRVTVLASGRYKR
jgi:hypothetical protein